MPWLIYGYRLNILGLSVKVLDIGIGSNSIIDRDPTIALQDFRNQNLF